ncbi:MAG: DUF192 domain-containing protein [Rhodobacteraceae bacterium]|nr:DUF192 domain-containing protein [Paracoccaceae bacterium]
MGSVHARHSLRLPGIIVAALCFSAGQAPAYPACSDDLASIVWDGGSAQFSIEIAATPQEREKGLMFREKLASSAGMLFIYERPGRPAFWMHNTLIPLDMLFLGADGRVNAVHAMARPMDDTPIPGPDATLMVLEINGGLAARLGITPGAVLRHPRLAQDTALLPCDEP